MASHTVKLWRDWVHGESTLHSKDWAEERLPMLIRSKLAIKLLDYSDTGAIAAAATTSLPEKIGGMRNWDYRFSWIRDTSLSVQALISLGHSEEAVKFLRWIENVSIIEFRKKGILKIMYGIHDESVLRERELTHLEGYRGSKPVRIGNGAATQFQLETYGELINTAHELLRRGYDLSIDVVNFLLLIADFICEKWKEPDHGIWEIRATARHFTYSKVMAWYALDTAAKLFHAPFPDKARKWKKEAGRISAAVLERGFSRKHNSFVQSFDSENLDASNLRIPLLEFLPMEDPRVEGTINSALKELTKDGLVYRYLNDDGLSGKEGDFAACSFWLVDVLALSGRVEEAKEVFSRTADRANHLGLFP